MALVMVITGILYVWLALQMPQAPSLVALVPYVLVVVTLSIAVQATLAIFSPAEANAPADERERVAIDRAGNWSGMVLAAGVVLAGGWYLSDPSEPMLFHYVFGSLVVSQIAEYVFQIALFRRAL
jgi:hypothetical protein